MFGLMFLLVVLGGLILPGAPVLAGILILAAAFVGSRLPLDAGEVTEIVMFYGALLSIPIAIFV